MLMMKSERAHWVRNSRLTTMPLAPEGQVPKNLLHFFTIGLQNHFLP